MLSIRHQPRRQDTLAEREARAAARAAHKEIKRERSIEDDMADAYEMMTRSDLSVIREYAA